MSMDDDQKRNMEKAEKETKRVKGLSRLKRIFLEAIVEKIRGKSIKKQLAWLLDPDNISTSSRLKRNEVIAITQADWLGRKFDRFQALRDFWIGVVKPRKEDFVKESGGGFARWVISIDGSGRTEGISMMQAQREQSILAPVIQAMKEEKK